MEKELSILGDNELIKAFYIPQGRNIVRVAYDLDKRLIGVYIRDADYNKHIFNENLEYVQTRNIYETYRDCEKKIMTMLKNAICTICQQGNTTKISVIESGILKNIRLKLED